MAFNLKESMIDPIRFTIISQNPLCLFWCNKKTYLTDITTYKKNDCSVAFKQVH